MTVNERLSVQKLMLISHVIQNDSKVETIKQEFLNEFHVGKSELSDCIKDLLQTAYNEKNAEDVDYSLFIGFAFDVFTEDFSDILCKLIEESWHFQHENIASILQKLKMPNTIKSLYNASLLKLKYLEYSEVEPLAVKCIWALGEIKTEEWV